MTEKENMVIDFTEYRRLRNQRENAGLLTAFEEFVKRQICARPLDFLRDMGKLRDALDAIREASRLPIPSISFDMPERPSFDSINIPMHDYTRLERMLDAIQDAEKNIYG